MADYRNPGWLIDSKDRVTFLRERGHIFWEDINNTKNLNSINEQLAHKLLTEDGVVVLFFPEMEEVENFQQKMLNRGELKDNSNLKNFDGMPSMCHANSAALWEVGKGKFSIVTGFGLSTDGIWRRHTWCVDINNDIVETTESRVLYYGIKLTNEESKSFVGVM
jgi:hypothetical protein